MMKHFKNILVATDTRLDAHPIVEEAALIAQRNGATLKLVDVVPDFSWLARMTVTDHESLRQLMGREKQTKLDELAAAIRKHGVDVEAKVLWGKTSVEIIREVLRGQHDLLLRVAKGHESRHTGFFGATGRRLLRDCPCAVWLVSAADKLVYTHVMGCIDTSSDSEIDAELNAKVYELASTISQQHKARFTLLHAWYIDAESMLSHRMSRADMAKLHEERKEFVETRLDAFLQSRETGGRPDNVELVKSDAPLLIPAYTKERSVDLVVMGTVARSGLTGMVIGNTAERILDDLQCSVLALKPNSFVSPITYSEYINPTTE